MLTIAFNDDRATQAGHQVFYPPKTKTQFAGTYTAFPRKVQFKNFVMKFG